MVRPTLAMTVTYVLITVAITTVTHDGRYSPGACPIYVTQRYVRGCYRY
jgi:hypothetical protein